MKHRKAFARLFTALLLIYTDVHLLKAQSGERWKVRDIVDQMDDTKGFEANLHGRVSDHGRNGTVEVTATCASEVVRLDVVYVSDTDKNMGFQQLQPSPSVNFSLINIPTPRVNMRIRIDNAPVKTISAQSDHANEANLFFSEISASQAMADMRGPSGSHDPTPLLRLFASSMSAGTIDELYTAQLIRLELPLANGDAPVLRITPRDDPDFQKFAARCKANYPMIKQTFISGGSAFHDPLPGGILGVLGSHRMIPAGGARFVAVTESEARDIVTYYWRVPGAQIEDKDYAPQFKSAEVLPARTLCSAVETYKQRDLTAGLHPEPSERVLVGVRVGRGQTVLVKLADGRLGLIPHDDLFSGYTDYRRKMPDPLQAPPVKETQRVAYTVPSDRQFTGTAEDFAAAFPGFLQRAAEHWKLDLRVFAPEGAYVVDLARRCARLTPEMLNNNLGNGEYKNCVSTANFLSQSVRNLPTPSAFSGRGIYLTARPGTWLHGVPFTMSVTFARLPSDASDASSPDYMIVQAVITRETSSR